MFKLSKVGFLYICLLLLFAIAVKTLAPVIFCTTPLVYIGDAVVPDDFNPASTYTSLSMSYDVASDMSINIYSIKKSNDFHKNTISI